MLALQRRVLRFAPSSLGKYRHVNAGQHSDHTPKWLESQVLRSATALLGKFISTREPNIKYLGLETLMRLVEVPAVVETIDKCV